MYRGVKWIDIRIFVGRIKGGLLRCYEISGLCVCVVVITGRGWCGVEVKWRDGWRAVEPIGLTLKIRSE